MTSVVVLLAESNQGGAWFRSVDGGGLGWLLVPFLTVIIVGVVVAVQRWAFARRDRGDEASSSQAEGAESIIHWNGHF